MTLQRQNVLMKASQCITGLSIESSHDFHIVQLLPIHPTTGHPLSSLKKRSLGVSSSRLEYEHQLSFEVSGFTQPLSLKLKRNDKLFSPTYQHIQGSESNTTESIRQEAPANCYYHGSIKGHDESLVALSACEGIHGIIHINSTARYAIHPLAEDVPHAIAGQDGHEVHLHKRHVLVKDQGYAPAPSSSDSSSASSNNEHAICGTSQPGFSVVPDPITSSISEGLTLAKDLLQSSSSPAPSSPHFKSAPATLAKRQTIFEVRNNKTIELLLASDFQRAASWGDETESTMIEMANYVHTLYVHGNLLPRPFALHVTLAGTYVAKQPMWMASETDRIDADGILNTWCAWREQQLLAPANARNPLGNNDIGMMLTGRTMTSGAAAVRNAASIEGYANVGALCTSDKSCGVVRGIRVVQLATQATVLAHEMGHTAGMGHDGNGNECPARGYIMEPSSCKDCGFIASTWSNCSREAISTFFASSDTRCLDSTPTLCGNGVVDEGEECDSGNRVNGSACCSPTCELRSGAQCEDKNGKCCQQCQLLSQGTPCRAKIADGSDRDSCDVADVCTGSSAVCPDTKRPNGSLCAIDPPRNTSMGTCNRGYCQSRVATCARLGYRYDAACDAGREQTCLLYCRSPRGCIRLSYQATAQLSVTAPDYSVCRNAKGDQGMCLAGRCITNSLEETNGDVPWSELGGGAGGNDGGVATKYIGGERKAVLACALIAAFVLAVFV
ncbi:hypothetical protein BCR44DRAFT_242298 [Catenaria anguillulae PL171]|uniref:Disintegrin and metalloproteinase domain-containing protein B n=1 Tax=Catenaria anguillulae PL171 TaxID=765915 RepID=A0A1Y2HU59_9FUNG|nr:hypothetical protein BCR44DRAFT_242298 [Catenaria anguillulae PL171]